MLGGCPEIACVAPDVHPQAHSGAGETYELSISKTVMYGSVGAVLVLLAVVLVVLTVFFSPSQRKLHR